MKKMWTKATPVGSAGFSMIDVLVAIVVLATALLALAALQGALTRNNADARARSQVVAYSEGLVDQLRSNSYDSIASATITPSNASGATAQQKEAYNAQVAAGVNGLSTTITSTAYYGTNAGTGVTFTTAAPSDLDSQTPRYKQVNVISTWTDATGQSRTLAVDTVISPLTISSDNSLDGQSLSISGSATPTVREYNPAATAGVIPIAIGSGQQTAATNPKPEILALNGNKTAVVGTSYNVLTYEDPISDLAVIQKRVETLVIACTCAFKGEANAAITTDDNTDFAALLEQPYRPTYWDGSQYAEPSTVAGSTFSGTQVDTSATQSAYCDICCRDHNDADADTVKFDPWTLDHAHYQYLSGATTPTAVTSGTFLNACRLIRVGGQYRVATDLNNYFFGLLATEDMPSTPGTTAIPDSTSTDCSDPDNTGVSYVDCYKDFIKKYLADSITTLAAGNGAIDSTTANGLYATYDLDHPTDISISATDTSYRYLHARGLYIDHLESDALKKINNAITNCTYTDTSACYLPLLPFTTINATELAVWESSSGTTLQVFNNEQNSISGDPTAPIRGYATAAANASGGSTANSTATIKLSNSGVAIADAVDLDDAATTSDAQQFTISGSNTGSTFTVSLSGVITSNGSASGTFTNYTSTTAPVVSWQIGTATTCAAAATGNGQWKSPNPYSCQTVGTNLSNTSLDVIVEKYNVQVKGSKVDNPCGGSGKVSSYSCVNYQVDTNAVTVNNASVTPTVTVPSANAGKLAESSIVSFTNINPNAAIVISLKSESSTTAPYTCNGTTPTYTCP